MRRQVPPPSKTVFWSGHRRVFRCLWPGVFTLWLKGKGRVNARRYEAQGHGEPGVGEDDLRSAAEVARILVDRVLAEAPVDDSKRIAVILDGLGSTKYEELFVVWGTVRKLLEDRGYTLVEPLVGEYVTSLDMHASEFWPRVVPLLLR